MSDFVSLNIPDSDPFRQISNHIQNWGNQHQEHLQQLQVGHSNLRGFWDGDGAEAYSQLHDQVQQTGNQHLQSMQKTVSQVNSAAGSLDDAKSKQKLIIRLTAAAVGVGIGLGILSFFTFGAAAAGEAADAAATATEVTELTVEGEQAIADAGSAMSDLGDVTEDAGTSLGDFGETDAPVVDSGGGDVETPNPEEVQTETPEITLPRGTNVYHATSPNSAYSIANDGILDVENGWGGGELGSGFYTATTPEGALGYLTGEEPGALLTFETNADMSGIGVVPPGAFDWSTVDPEVLQGYLDDNDFLTNTLDNPISQYKFNPGNGGNLTLTNISAYGQEFTPQGFIDFIDSLL